VVLCGALNQDEVRQLMQDAAVFCLPCIRDTDGNQDALPTVLLESMACGLPVVSTRLSGIPEIVDDGVNASSSEQAMPGPDGGTGTPITSTDLRRSYAEAGRRKPRNASASSGMFQFCGSGLRRRTRTAWEPRQDGIAGAGKSDEGIEPHMMRILYICADPAFRIGGRRALRSMSATSRMPGCGRA